MAARGIGALMTALLLGGAAPQGDTLPDEHRLAEARIAAASSLRRVETQAAMLVADLEVLQARVRGADAQLAQRSAALSPLLPLMQRLSLHPVETMLAMPAPPERALLGIQVLRGMARQVQRDAAALRADAADAAAAATATRAALDRLASVQAVQAEHGALLDAQIAAARASRLQAEDAAAEQARRAAVDAARAETLRAALAGMEAERARAEARAAAEATRAERARQDAAAAEARHRQRVLARPAGPGLAPVDPAGPMFAPAAGQVVRGWGERTDAGPATGLTVRPPPAARVTAPCSGRTAFAGPFRTYGVLLILDCGGGYHFVLAGFERLDLAVGMAVQRGEPVGAMPAWDPRGTAARPGLYIELRHDGQPVDPTPFLRTRG